VSDAARAKDPDNKLLWHRKPTRLEGESIRDALLAAAGTLDPKMYGRTGLDLNVPRRSIYLRVKRSELIPFLTLFDAPEPAASVGERGATTLPTQALAMMNSPTARTWARAFAARITAVVGAAPDSHARFIEAAYAAALGRGPSEDERRAATEFLAAQTAAHTAGGQRDATAAALTDFCQVLMGLNETLHIE